MKNLDPKEKRTVIVGGAVALVILLYGLYAYVLSPLSNELARKRDHMPKKEQDLVEMQSLRDQYKEMQLRLQQAQEAASKRGPLLTEIENLTKRANLQSKIVSLKPQTGVQAGGITESIVEVKLDNITLYDIVNYVYLIEKDTLRIKKLYFKPRFDNPKLLNATILVSSAG